MDYFDKKIKDLYNQPEHDIPTDLSWDYMEDGIYSIMDRKKTKRKIIGYWFVGSLIVLLMAIGVIKTYIIQDSSKSVEGNNKIATNTIINTEADRSLETTSVENTKNINSTAQEVDENLSLQKNRITQNSIIKYTSKNIEKNLKEVESKNVEKTNNLSKDYSIPQKRNNNSNSSPSLSTKRIESESPSNQHSINNTRKKLRVDLLVLSSLEELKAQRTPVQSSIKVTDYLDKSLPIKANNHSKYIIALLGGTSIHSGFNILNQEHLTALPGYSTRLGFTMEKEDNWGIDIGLGHSLLVEKFDLDQTDTISTHHENIVTGNLTNTLTGNTSTIIGDGYRDSSRTRTVVAYNTINILSLDASVYRRLNISEKWSLISSLGIQLDRITKIEGTTLDGDNELFTYSNTTSGISKNLLSTRLGLGIDYDLTNRYAINFRASSTYSFNPLYLDKKLGAILLQGGVSLRL